MCVKLLRATRQVESGQRTGRASSASVTTLTAKSYAGCPAGTFITLWYVGTVRVRLSVGVGVDVGVGVCRRICVSIL